MEIESEAPISDGILIYCFGNVFQIIYLILVSLFNFYEEYIKWNAGLDEDQTRIKIAKRNINNLKYEHDTTLMAESKEDHKSQWMKVKEESKEACLKFNIQKN